MSLKMVRYDGPRTMFHSHYGAVLYRLRDIASYWSKIAYLAPQGMVRILQMCLILIKLE